MQAAISNFGEFEVSFYLREMRHAKANNTLAVSSRHPRGRLEEIQHLSVCARLWSIQTSWTRGSCTAPTKRLTSIYNFGAVSPTKENFSRCPAPCFLLSKCTKRYAVPVVSDAKTDTKFVVRGGKPHGMELRNHLRSHTKATQ